MSILGVDYSLNSPVVCIFNPDKLDILECGFAFIAQKKAQEGKFHTFKPKDGFCSPFGEDIEVRGHDRYQRNLSMIDWAVTNYRPTKVCFEGYAFAAKGDSAYQLAENGGIAKHWLWNKGIDVEIYAPNTVKKYATGNGNADKKMMYKAWLKAKGPDLEKLLEGKADKNPISDIVDAYWVAHCGADPDIKPYLK